MRRLKIHFVPVSGPTGSGEYMRCLCIADAIHKANNSEIRFYLSRHASYAETCPYPVTLLDQSATRETDKVLAGIEAERPDIVIFDSAGRKELAQQAQALGAKTIFISSRKKKHKKADSLRWRKHLDQHWIVDPFYQPAKAGFLKRKAGMMSHQFDTIFSADLDESVLEKHGLQRGEYILSVPGGGGWEDNGKFASEIFAEALQQLGEPCIALMGDRFDKPPPALNGPVLLSLPNAQVMALLQHAKFAIVGGGSALLQTMALRTPAIAVPTGAPDQPGRIAACQPLCLAADLDATSIATQARKLLNANQNASITTQLAQRNLRNGTPETVAQLLSLITQ